MPQTLLEVQYSPTLAGAMVDALPYMVEYPYGCTEQTLNRFLPTVITLRTLQRMKIDLADVQKKRTNLNAQEIGNDRERAAQWKRFDPSIRCPLQSLPKQHPEYPQAQQQSIALHSIPG